MAKLYLNDLASVLIEKHKLTKQEASRFLTAIVEVIHDAVATDKQVKVKGLGTFKVIEVDARESVNVNTGERFIIDGHQKLTFTPDNTMKELVNKPFSQFETVILNDNVTFEEASPDPSEGEEEEPVEELEPVQTEEPAVISSLFQTEKPAQEEEPSEEEPAEEETAEEEPTEEEPTEEEPAEEEPAEVEPAKKDSENEEPAKENPTDEEPAKEDSAEEEPSEDEPAKEEPTDEEPVQDEEPNEPSSRKMWPLRLGIAVLACALCFVAGYFVGQKSAQATPNEDTHPADTLVTAPVVVTDTTHVQAADSLVQQQDTVANEQQPELNVEQLPQQQEEDYLKYEEMDSRVRLGAYHIIGTDFIVKARPGDNTARIARRTLGAGMECYIEVYNNIEGRTTLQEGQEVKIPKLRMKESVRKRIRR